MERHKKIFFLESSKYHVDYGDMTMEKLVDVKEDELVYHTGTNLNLKLIGCSQEKLLIEVQSKMPTNVEFSMIYTKINDLKPTLQGNAPRLKSFEMKIDNENEQDIKANNGFILELKHYCMIRIHKFDSNLDETSELYRQTVSLNMRSWLEKPLEENFNDCILQVGKNRVEKDYKVHKFTLCQRSSHFKTLLETPDGENSVIRIKKYDPDIMDHIVRFIYGGVLEYVPENLLEFIQAANYFGIKDLKHLLEAYLCRIVPITPHADMIQLSADEFYEFPRLLSDDWEFRKKADKKYMDYFYNLKSDRDEIGRITDEKALLLEEGDYTFEIDNLKKVWEENQVKQGEKNKKFSFKSSIDDLELLMWFEGHIAKIDVNLRWAGRKSGDIRNSDIGLRNAKAFLRVKGEYLPFSRHHIFGAHYAASFPSLYPRYTEIEIRLLFIRSTGIPSTLAKMNCSLQNFDTLTNDISYIRRLPKFPNVVLKTRKRKFEGHKVVLARNSEYLRKNISEHDEAEKQLIDLSTQFNEGCEAVFDLIYNNQRLSSVWNQKTPKRLSRSVLYFDAIMLALKGENDGVFKRLTSDEVIMEALKSQEQFTEFIQKIKSLREDENGTVSKFVGKVEQLYKHHFEKSPLVMTTDLPIAL